MKIAVAYVYGENFADIAGVCIPSLKKYCEKHKYCCHIRCTPKNKKGWYGFINTKYGRELLEHYDAVFMIEGDFMITNHNIKIEDFINDEHHFYICKDVNDYNGGSWIAKGTEAAKTWLDIVNSYEDRFEHEQSVFETLCNFYVKAQLVKILPHPSINSVPFDRYAPSYGKIGYREGEIVEKPTIEQGDWEKGNFVCHLPGKSLEERLKIFNEIREEIIYE